MVREALLRGAGLAAAALLGVGAATRSPAHAASPDKPTVQTVPAASTPFEASSVIGGPSTCPRPEAVWSELVTLVPRERLEARLRAVTRDKTEDGLRVHNGLLCYQSRGMRTWVDSANIRSRGETW